MSSGTVSDAGSKPRQCGGAAAIGGEGEAADGDRTAAGGLLCGIGDGRSRQRPPALGDALKRDGPLALMLVACAEPCERSVRALGLLEHEPVLTGAPRGTDDGCGIELVGERAR